MPTSTCARSEVRYGKAHLKRAGPPTIEPSRLPKASGTKNTAANLLNRLDTYRDDVLRFTTDFNVDFSNNQGERDIRMVKLQQKISGSWRTKAGADHFCAIRSYVSTMKKHGYNVLDGLQDLFEGRSGCLGGPEQLRKNLPRGKIATSRNLDPRQVWREISSAPPPSSPRNAGPLLTSVEPGATLVRTMHRC